MRLIDGDALLQRAVPHGWSTPKWVSDIMIEDAPTIDAVPVVRCGECVHGHRYFEAYGLDCLSCRKLVDKNGNGVEFPVLPDGYCSDGQRGEDGDGDV